MIGISRSTSASFAPIPLIVETDQGTYELSVPGPEFFQRIPGRRVYRVFSPAHHMFLITLVAGDEEYNLAHHDPAHIRGITNITITDGFLWANPMDIPRCTYRGVTTYSGYPELNDYYIIGAPCPPWMP